MEYFSASHTPQVKRGNPPQGNGSLDIQLFYFSWKCTFLYILHITERVIVFAHPLFSLSIKTIKYFSIIGQSYKRNRNISCKMEFFKIHCSDSIGKYIIRLKTGSHCLDFKVTLTHESFFTSMPFHVVSHGFHST
jgi:hypothetical protein